MGQFLRKLKTVEKEHKTDRRTNMSFLDSNGIKTTPYAGQDPSDKIKIMKIGSTVQELCVDAHRKEKDTN